MASREAATSGKGVRSKTLRKSAESAKPSSAQSWADSGLAESDEYSSDESDVGAKVCVCVCVTNEKTT